MLADDLKLLENFMEKGFYGRPESMSSATDLWSTPQDFFDRMNNIFHFELDVCATKEDAKCENYFTPEQDGLLQDWRGVCWMNPPYGKTIGEWMKKAYLSALQNGATVVCLIPARIDTGWWCDYAERGEITLLRGRLKFGGKKNPAPFPSAIVVFRPRLPARILANKDVGDFSFSDTEDNYSI